MRKITMHWVDITNVKEKLTQIQGMLKRNDPPCKIKETVMDVTNVKETVTGV